MSLLDRALRIVGSVARGALRDAATTPGRSARSGPRSRSPQDRRGEPGGARTVREHDVARYGLPPLRYEPADDGDADPGEVVWAWVPYEEDDGQGKDRPVLVLTRHGGGLLGLQLTSKDHDRDRDEERRRGRIWMDVGSGAWDSRGRPSEARLDRVLFLPSDAVRREGAALPPGVFAQVADALGELHGR